MKQQGQFISFEGVEGGGKSSNIQFVKQWLTQRGIEVVVTREPGGTEIAESVRAVLLAHYQEVMDSDAELLLMFAARVQHVNTLIKPALAQGKWVLSDRFVDASYAYQSAGRGIAIQRLQQLDQWSLDGFRPALTFLFDLPVELGMARARGRGALDRFESEDMAFFQRIRQYYLALQQAEPERVQYIDAQLTLEEVQRQLVDKLECYFDRIVV